MASIKHIKFPKPGKSPFLHITGHPAHFTQHRVGETSLVQSSRVRVWPFIVMAFTIFIALTGRVFQLTIIEGNYHRDRADSNRVVGVRRAAARGILFDRNKQPLVANSPSYKRQIPGSTVTQSQFEPISREEAVRLSQGSGERIFFDVTRSYPCGAACAIVSGYMSEVSREELDDFNGDYVLGDWVGAYGLEKVYESRLRGTPGNELVEVNAKGQLVREVGTTLPVSGTDMQLTIDQGLQKVLYQAFEGRKGAAIAQIPQTGEILALVSSPSFDPNNVSASLDSSDQPFFNRAVGGVYPPGSTFKIITAIAALEEQKIDSSTLIEDTGEIKIDQYRYGNWLYDQYGRTEGEVDVIKALQRSNDIFFYHIGASVGPDKIAEWARTFGYENSLFTSGMVAAKGTIPDPNWKETVKGERWFLGNTYHMSIGQGDVLTTPLQVNRMMGAVATGGALCDPIIDLDEVRSKSCMQLNLSSKTVELVHEGLKRACLPGGTGAPFFNTEPAIACKTGTAQQGGETHLPHAWFTLYAPADNPEIVITVLVEEGGQGSEVAAPIAKIATDYWFSR